MIWKVLLTSTAVAVVSAHTASAGACTSIVSDPENYFSKTDRQHFYDCLSDDPDLASFKTSSGQTLMHFAGRFATEPFVPLFLAEFGVSPVEQDDDGNSPLHLAATRDDYVPIIATLLAIGADKEEFNDKDERAYDLNSGNYPDIQALLLPDEMKEELLPADIEENAAEVACGSYLTNDFFLNSSPSDIFFCASKSKPSASNADGNTALHLAAAYATDLIALDAVLSPVGKPETIQKLLGARNFRGQTALHMAARYSNIPGKSAWLVAWGSDVNAMAKQEKSWDRVRKYGTTPLHYAAFRRDDFQYIAVEELLAAGAKALIQDRTRRIPNGDQEIGRQTPLHYAVVSTNEQSGPDALTVRLLLEAEVSQSSSLDPVSHIRGRKPKPVKDSAGRTALHYAAAKDAPSAVITVLLDYGFKPTAESNDERTPLSLYAELGPDPDMMLSLLEHAMTPSLMSSVPGLGSMRKTVCQKDSQGISALAHVRNNPKLNAIDPSGVAETPLSKLTALCAK